MRKLPWFYLSVLMSVFLGGAALTKIYHSSPSAQDNIPIAQVPTPPSLDYHLLAADLAWQRELWPEAATHYLKLAQDTMQAEFALLATSAALEAKMVTTARQSAQIWANIEPENAKAHALTAALCIAESNTDLGFLYLTQLIEYTPNDALPHLLMINTSLQDPKEQEIYLGLLQRLTLTHEHQPSIWFALARQAQTMHQYAFALTAADHSLALRPDWISAIALRVQILYQMDEKILARDYLAQVTQQFPHHNDLQFIYSQISKEINNETISVSQ